MTILTITRHVPPEILAADLGTENGRVLVEGELHMLSTCAGGYIDTTPAFVRVHRRDGAIRRLRLTTHQGATLVPTFDDEGRMLMPASSVGELLSGTAAWLAEAA